MLASNERPSRRSMRIFFDELSPLAEELQNIIPEDTITYKERIREALNGLQYLKVTNYESRQHLEPLDNLFNVLYQDLSCQPGSSDPRVTVFRRTVSTLTPGGPGRTKYEIPGELFLYFKPFGFTWNAIADTVLVSRWTLRRRVIEYGITDLVGFSKISNDELDNSIRDYRNTYGLACGRSMILGHLNSMEIKV